jgi:hypothetical protein
MGSLEHIHWERNIDQPRKIRSAAYRPGILSLLPVQKNYRVSKQKYPADNGRSLVRVEI